MTRFGGMALIDSDWNRLLHEGSCQACLAELRYSFEAQENFSRTVEMWTAVQHEKGKRADEVGCNEPIEHMSAESKGMPDVRLTSVVSALAPNRLGLDACANSVNTACCRCMVPMGSDEGDSKARSWCRCLEWSGDRGKTTRCSLRQKTYISRSFSPGDREIQLNPLFIHSPKPHKRTSLSNL